jgi:nucleoside 2-deoxyribosyltransferase
MTKRFYLATRKDREAQANAISEALNSQGWQRTFVWIAQDSADTDRHAMVAQQELDAIRDADVLIVLLPGGYGTHVEIGAALALGKPVILHSPDRKTLDTPYPCIFHYHPGVRLIISEVVDLDAILASLP